MKKKIDKEASEQRVSQILSEDILTIDQAREELERVLGHRFNIATLWRWVHRGVGGVRLDTIRVGKSFMTSRQAIHRFIVERS